MKRCNPIVQLRATPAAHGLARGISGGRPAGDRVDAMGRVRSHRESGQGAWARGEGAVSGEGRRPRRAGIAKPPDASTPKAPWEGGGKKDGKAEPSQPTRSDTFAAEVQTQR
jgi:hypothetical protein